MSSDHGFITTNVLLAYLPWSAHGRHGIKYVSRVNTVHITTISDSDLIAINLKYNKQGHTDRNSF